MISINAVWSTTQRPSWGVAAATSRCDRALLMTWTQEPKIPSNNLIYIWIGYLRHDVNEGNKQCEGHRCRHTSLRTCRQLPMYISLVSVRANREAHYYVCSGPTYVWLRSHKSLHTQRDLLGFVIQLGLWRVRSIWSWLVLVFSHYLLHRKKTNCNRIRSP